MSRNGSGTYTLPAGNPVVTGTTITSSWANTTMQNIADGLTQSVASDGQTPMSGALNMATNKVTNLGTPTVSTDAVTKAYADALIGAGSAGIFSSVTDSGLTSGRVTYASTGGLLADSATFTYDGTTVTSTKFAGAFNGTLGATTPTTAVVTSLTDSGLTTGRVTYATTAGLLTDSANLTFNGTTLTTANDASISGLTVGKGLGNQSSNTAIGNGALGSNTSGNTSSAFGFYSLISNTTGSGNSSYGYTAMQNNTTGSNNVAYGHSALFSNTTASGNSAIGYQAGYTNTTGNYITTIGYQAGYNITTGSANICIGGISGASLTTGSNNAYIGYTVASSGSVGQEFVLGLTASTPITGKGTNTGFIYTGGGGVYQGNNSATWSITSDQRLKKNIVDNTIGLSAITAIQVRNFEYRTANEVTDLPSQNAIDIKGVQLGAIAQELQAILPDCVKTESTGVMSVDASNLTWYLINAVKELNAKVTALEAQLGAK